MKDILFSALCILVLLCGCGRKTAPEKTPERILSLSGAATGILLQLGVVPAAVDQYGSEVPGAEKIPVAGKGSALSREKLAELQIDGALIWYYQEEVRRELEHAGIRVLSVPPMRLREIPAWIVQTGEFCGRKEAAEALSAEFSRRISEITVAEPEKTVYVYWELYAPGKAAGEESYAGDLLRAAGCRSVIRKTGVVSGEFLAERPPDVILYVEGYGDPAAILRRPELRKSPAAEHDRIYAVPRRLLMEGVAPLEAIAFLKEKIAGK